VPVNIAELERRARRVLTPEVYDYYAGGSGSERTPQTSGVRDLLTGMTDDPAHEMALGGARTLAGSAGVTGPTTAHSLDT
jgi:hypothetical protein